MSWHDSTQTKRASVAAWSTGTAGTYDATVVPPADWQEFWGSVMSSGYDVRFYSADGTALTYARSSWTYASRTASFRVTGIVTTAADQIVQFFMYWGASASDGATSPAVGNGPLTCAILYAATPSTVVNARPQPAGATSPAVTVTKATGDTIWLWWDVASLLLQRETAYNGYLSYEEVFRVTDVTVSTGGAAQSAMTSESATKIKDGRYIVTQHTAGSSGTKYVVSLDFSTTLGRAYDVRVQLTVQDVLEA